MINDRLSNSKQYEKLSALFKIAFDFLREYKGMEIGKYQLKDGVFVLVQAYNSKDEKDCKWETHRKYIDIQYVLKGEETIAVANYNDLKCTVLYDSEKDISFYEGVGNEIRLTDSEFLILYPWDAHKPQIGNGKSVNKIVVKVPYI